MSQTKISNTKRHKTLTKYPISCHKLKFPIQKAPQNFNKIFHIMSQTKNKFPTQKAPQNFNKISLSCHKLKINIHKQGGRPFCYYFLMWLFTSYLWKTL